MKVTNREYRYLDLSSENWLILEDLAKVLEPLECATVFLSMETNVSLSAVLPVVYGLVSKLAATEDGSQCIRQFKVKVVAALKVRWELNDFDTKQVSILTTALDPRFRQLKFLSDAQRGEVKAELLRRAAAQPRETATEDPQGPPAAKKPKTAFDVLLGEEEESSDDDCEGALSQYLVEKVTTRDTKPLNCWKKNEFRFPQLAEVAKSVLCIPATSMPSERLFSG